MLTTSSNRSEDGRRSGLDGEGRSLAGMAMAAAVWGLISAGVGHGRARGGAEWVRGEVARLWARRIEAGQQEGGEERPEASTASSARLGSARARGMEKGRTELEASQDHARRRAASSAMADVWKLAAGHSRRYGVGAAQ